jgi:hypothetical protein
MLEDGIDVAELWAGSGDTHVADTEVLSGNFLVDTTGQGDALLQQGWEEVSVDDALWQVDGSHAVSRVVSGDGDGLEAEVGNGVLDLVGGGLVVGNSLLDRLVRGCELGEGLVEGIDVLDGWGGKVGWLAGLVGLHDWDPSLERGEVGGHWGLSVLDGLDGSRRCIRNGEAWWGANGLLGGSQDVVQAPLVELDLLRGNGAHAVDDDEGVWGDLVHELGNRLDVGKDASGGVDMGDGDHLVELLLEGSLNLVERWSVANCRGDLVNLGTVDLQTVGKCRREVAGVEHKGVLARLNKVGRNNVPTKRAGASNDEGLGVGVLGEEQLTGHLEGVAKGLDKGSRGVRLGVVAHGLQDLVIKLDGTWNHGQRMWLLVRHSCTGFVGGKFLCLFGKMVGKQSQSSGGSGHIYILDQIGS